MNILEGDPILHLNNTKQAIKNISYALKKGSLALFIGAGVSKAASGSFPKWDELVVRLCEEIDVPYDKSKLESNKYLRTLINDVEKNLEHNEYINLIKNKLYEGVNYDYDMLSMKLLVAIGSLIMGSVRGSSGIVINYNFDDILEWYLSYHGFKTQVISIPSQIIEKSDVTIYHPHGFLPKSNLFKEFENNKIIFSQRSYLTANAEQVDPLNELQRSVLSSKIPLFIGMSGDDEHIESLCNLAYEKIVNYKRLLGYIVISKQDKGHEDKIKPLLDVGLATILIDQYDDLPNLLLDICRKAAGL